jgi:hypothetical protein
MIRSVLAVITGYVLTAVIVIACTLLAAKYMIPEDAVEPPRAYLIVNIAYSLLAAMAGGYLTAWIARRAPLAHAGALALVVVTMGVATMAGGPQGQAGVFGWGIVGLGVIGALGGGALRAVQVRRSPAEPQGISV